MTYQNAVVQAAKKRGWKVLRKAGHNQIILTHPETGGRFSVLSTSKSQISIGQIIARMQNIEQKSDGNRANEFLDWLCKRSGISPMGAAAISVKLGPEIRKFDGSLTEKQVTNLESRVRTSDRLWSIDLSRRGAYTVPMRRLLLGSEHILTNDEWSTIRLYPQVNGYLPRASEVKQKLTKSYVKLNEIDKAVAEREGIDVGGEPMRERIGEHGVEPVQNEGPQPALIHESDEAFLQSLKERSDEAMRVTHTNGHKEMPPELVAALKAFYAPDNGDLVAAVEMARDALDAAEKAVQEARVVLDLVKAG